MTTELITMNTINLAENIQFKDERLKKATDEILRIYQNAVQYADSKNRQIASILATVKVEQSYKEDGFESVAHFAEEVFGIKRQNAYSLATAGEIYNDSNASERLKAFSPSKIAEIASVPRETLEADVESGKITPTTTQKDLREYRNQNTKKEGPSGDVIVQDFYTARPVDHLLLLPQGLHDLLSSGPRIMEDWDSEIVDYLNQTGAEDPDVIKLSKGFPVINGRRMKKRTINRRLYITPDFALAVEFTTYKPPVIEKRDEDQPRKFTREELMAMLEELGEED